MDEVSLPAEGPMDSIEAGVSALFAEEHRAMVRMATLMVGSAAMAEEVVQEAFVSVSQRWDSVDRPGAYLRQTVVNGCAQVLRRRSVEARYARIDVAPDHVEIPTRLLEVRDALDRLSERQRIVVVLRYFVDIADWEIAELMGVRPATVRSLVRRALASLRKDLK